MYIYWRDLTLLANNTFTFTRNPLTPKISFIILLTVCYTVLLKLSLGNLVMDQVIIPN